MMSDTECPHGGRHALVWDYEYCPPIKLYGQWEGGGRFLGTVHCTTCDYKSPYYHQKHEPLMNEPYRPDGLMEAT